MPTQCAEKSREPVVVVIDARELRRASIVELLRPWASEQELQVQARSPAGGLEMLEDESDLRLIVLSVGSTSMAEKETQQQLKVLRALGGGIPIVIVSDREEPNEVVAALGLGVQGFLPTAIRPELALQALSFIVSGGSYFPPAAIRQLQHIRAPGAPSAADRGEGEAGDGRGSGRGDPERTAAREGEDAEASCPAMTIRQREVLTLLRQGEPNKIIARKLGMTEATVKVHVRQIMRKLGATNRTQAALSAADHERQLEGEAAPSVRGNGGSGSLVIPPRFYAAE
jgi:DNA-binding NarL/FixJ family response regulator